MNNFLTVQLPAKVKIQALGGREVEIDKIEIHQMVDSPLKKTVWAHCRNYPNRILLWEGAAYDAIGQWTDTDITARILELYTAP